jgi:DHA1 family bicyclomycin/chloramphenicol resistance-like MFS transporter
MAARRMIPQPSRTAQAHDARVSARSIVVLAGLTAFGPLTIDLYLPGLPSLARDLGTSVATAQVTLTACVLGLAVGQVLAGPVGDRFGRRQPLLLALVVFAGSSAACAAADSIAAVTALRVAQGLAGAAGITLARAMVRDSFTGPDLARTYATLAAIVSVTPVLAPTLGGVLLLIGNWRTLFLVLAAIGLALLLGAAAWTTETLPRHSREAAGAGAVLRGFRGVLVDRHYLGYTVPGALAAILMFGFLTASSFVYEGTFGLSPALYGVLFGVNGVVLVASNVANRRLLNRIPERRLFEVGLAWIAAGGIAVCVAAGGAFGPEVIVPLVWVALAGLGFVLPNSMALALGGQQARIGTAVGVMGLLQFMVGAVVPAVFGFVGTTTMTMGVVMAAGGVLPLLAYRQVRPAHAAAAAA